jgi:hypothetical protein
MMIRSAKQCVCASFFLLALLFSIPGHAQGVRHFAFKTGDKWGVKRNSGEVVVPPAYNFIGSFDLNGRACFYCTKNDKDRRLGMIDTSGKVIIECRYYMCLDFTGGYAVTGLKNGKKGMVDVNGRLLLQPEYDEVKLFSEGRALVAKDNKYGFIDESGAIVIPMQFDSAVSFSNNRALVIRNGMVGYIDHAGREVIPYDFQPGSASFSDGTAIVKKNGRSGMIDTMGNIIIPLKYDYVAPFEGRDYTRVKEGRREGYANLQGTEAMGNHGEYCFSENEKKSFNELKTEILLLNSCDSAGHIDRKVAIAKARARGYEGEFRDDINDYREFPHPFICLVVHKGECCWKITIPSVEYSREGECAHTNGCTVFVNRSILIDARFGKIISENTERTYFPNYE